jgi:hypothetical protein
MNIGKFSVNSEKANSGVWMDAGDGLKLKIARLNNEAFKKFIRQRGKALSVQIRTGNLDNEQAVELQRQGVAKTVLMGWENLQDEETQQDITFSPEKALQLFIKYPDFYDLVLEFAGDAANFKNSVEVDAAGN